MARAHELRRLFVWSSMFLAPLIAAPSFAADDPPAKENPHPKAEARPTAVEKPAETSLPPSELPPGSTIFHQSDIERKIRAELDRPTEMQYLDTLLADVAADLEVRHKINIELDHNALTADGKGSDMLINKQLKDLSLKSALHLLLEEQGLTYVIKNEALLITTLTAAETYATTRVYQVHDLVVMRNDPTAAKPDFAWLTGVITATIQPESWRSTGGVSGEMKEFLGPGVLALVITQTEQNHEQIEALLKLLREAREPKVLEAQRRAKPVKDPDPPAKTDKSGGGFF